MCIIDFSYSDTNLIILTSISLKEILQLSNLLKIGKVFHFSLYWVTLDWFREDLNLLGWRPLDFVLFHHRRLVICFVTLLTCLAPVFPTACNSSNPKTVLPLGELFRTCFRLLWPRGQPEMWAKLYNLWTPFLGLCLSFVSLSEMHLLDPQFVKRKLDVSVAWIISVAYLSRDKLRKGKLIIC